MKKLLLVLAALSLAAIVFADNAKKPLVLVSADNDVSVVYETLSSREVGALLDKEMNVSSDRLSAKVSAKASAALTKDVLDSVKF